MIASEMVAKLRIAMGDEVEPYMVSTQTIFEWLSDAYLRIQIEYDQWKFFHSRDLILTTVAGRAEYELYNVKEISKDSVYCNKVGESTRFPMYFWEYDNWVAEEQVNLQMQGTPRYFISLPNGNYRIEPDPTEVWQIWGDVWYKPAGFEFLSDEPIWDEKFHSLIVWEALKVASMEWPDSKKAQRMQANIAVNLVPMRRAFNYEYLESKGSARAML
jgi:hypothetical protein